MKNNKKHLVVFFGIQNNIGYVGSFWGKKRNHLCQYAAIIRNKYRRLSQLVWRELSEGHTYHRATFLL